jgi:ATP phosphoribosyltransferase regulatory subunit HisZ
LGYVPVIGEQISSFGKFADAAKSFSTELAGSGISLRMRNLISLYEKADIRQHATLSTAANDSKERLVTFLLCANGDFFKRRLHPVTVCALGRTSSSGQI